MPNPMQKTKTKTIVAIALVTLAIAGLAAGIVIARTPGTSGILSVLLGRATNNGNNVPTSISLSPGGINYFTQGMINGKEDYCTSDCDSSSKASTGNCLTKYFKDGSGNVQSQKVTCETGCQNGACVRSSNCTTPPVAQTDPAGTIVLQEHKEYGSASAPITVAGQGVQYFKFTAPAGGCPSSGNGSSLDKAIIVTLLTNSLAAGTGHLLIKSSNHGASSWPTVDDYKYFLNQSGLGPDWKRDSNGGAFWWRNEYGAEINVAILPSYAGHTFNQDDTYYGLLYNAGNKDPNATGYFRLLWQCY